MLAIAAATGCGLAFERAGARATQGASAKLEAQAHAEPGEPGPVAERVARGTVAGILAELETPAHREDLRRITAAASASVVDGLLAEATRPEQLAHLRWVAQVAAASALRGFTHGDGGLAVVADQTMHGLVAAVSRELGTEGDGPLARSLYATAEQLSASTMRGIRGEVGLFAECRGPGRDRCIDQRLMDLSRAASLGVRDGIRGLIEIPLLVISFLLGLIVALGIAWARSHRRGPSSHQQASVQGPTRAPVQAG